MRFYLIGQIDYIYFGRKIWYSGNFRFSGISEISRCRRILRNFRDL